jgi:hypothetical protein
LIGTRREQDGGDGGPGDGARAVRPGGDNPEQRNGADRGGCARCIDQNWQPIGHAEVDEARTAPYPTCGIGDQQRQAIQCLREPNQNFGRLVSEKA